MLYNISNDKVVVENIIIADSFAKRLKGLMGKTALGKSEGLILMSCKSIHTCFMRFPIDVVFLDMNYKVIQMRENLKPWRMLSGNKKAYIVVELVEGTIAYKGISIGDTLIIK